MRERKLHIHMGNIHNRCATAPCLASLFLIVACGPRTADAEANVSLLARDTGGVAATPAVASAPTALPAAGGKTIDRTNRTGAVVLHDIFLEAGEIDGARNTDFRLIQRCRRAFFVAGRTTTIDWSTVGNFAGRDVAWRTVINIDDGSGSHAISAPSGTQPEPLGNASARVDGGLSVIADTCAS